MIFSFLKVQNIFHEVLQILYLRDNEHMDIFRLDEHKNSNSHNFNQYEHC